MTVEKSIQVAIARVDLFLSSHVHTFVLYFTLIMLTLILIYVGSNNSKRL